MTEKGKKLYEGKAKILYETEDPNWLLVEFKDAATAFDGKKRGIIEGKGVHNNRLSAFFFAYLTRNGIPTHYVRQLSDREMLVRRLEIIKVEVVMRNVVAGSLAKRLGLPEGTVLDEPVLEHYYKSDELGDPMINQYHIRALRLATEEEMTEISRLAFRINDLLRAFLSPRNLDLIDFKLEFGRDEGKIVLGDEISPDTCRFWDTKSGERLDKDRFRRDLGGVEEAYQEVVRRVTGT
ncbi:MAG: phosphoribosylaminoimidazolesuccinocarboxamide synthase [Firmicutes bacterium]|nr:phosphoribosylaminoimidazolesuccinocarboxamide synthase [Bacillota bacterium]